MVSDEQRREIAANLRSESEAWSDTFPDSTLNDEDNDAIMFDISRFLLFEGTPTVGEFYARLADLIERPTCTNVSARKNNEFLCSECRCQLEITRVTDISPDGLTLVTENVVPGFCPACGAEVVPHAERRD